MSKEPALKILRYALTAVGAYLMGQNFFGQAIDATLWEGILGATMTAVGTVWGILDKTATEEMIQSGLRSVIVFFGSAMVGAGLFKSEVLTFLVEATAIMVPFLSSQLSKSKNRRLESGALGMDKLKK